MRKPAILGRCGIGTLTANEFLANLSGQAVSAAECIIYKTDTGRLFFDVDGVGGSARIQFASLTAGLVLVNADFVVF